VVDKDAYMSVKDIDKFDLKGAVEENKESELEMEFGEPSDLDKPVSYNNLTELTEMMFDNKKRQKQR
jgi:hypothetical protein